uniref:OSK domain-containing protein n=1 Tax=Clastoptera arizonana TaxID=38151 RepID=A0A1B6BZT7_9HEMI
MNQNNKWSVTKVSLQNSDIKPKRTPIVIRFDSDESKSKKPYSVVRRKSEYSGSTIIKKQNVIRSINFNSEQNKIVKNKNIDNFNSSDSSSITGISYEMLDNEASLNSSQKLGCGGISKKAIKIRKHENYDIKSLILENKDLHSSFDSSFTISNDEDENLTIDNIKNESSSSKLKRKYIVINNETEKQQNISKRVNIKLNDSDIARNTPDNRNRRKYIEIKHDIENPDSRKKRKYTEIKYNLEESHFDPNFIGYQLVGDSQFCRFGQQILNLERVATPNGKGRIGICVSGQTILDLHNRVKEGYYPISKKIILMIGTNDLLRNQDGMTMCHHLSDLVYTLKQRTENIVLFTLPPIPKIESDLSHWDRLEMYNNHIKYLCDEATC